MLFSAHGRSSIFCTAPARRGGDDDPGIAELIWLAGLNIAFIEAVCVVIDGLGKKLCRDFEAGEGR